MHRGLELKGVNVLAQALMGTVQRHDIGRMQLGKLLLELPYLQSTGIQGRDSAKASPLVLHQARRPTSDFNSWTCLWYSAARASAIGYVLTALEAVHGYTTLMSYP